MAMMMDSTEMDKLSYEIFSILENRFLFGACYDDSSLPQTPVKNPKSDAGKVRILSIDGGIGAASDGLLAGAALARLETSLRSRSGDPNARIADFFDVAAGSGSGGVLVATLFTRGADGRPLFTADEALRFVAKNRRAIDSLNKKGLLRGLFRRSGGIFRRTFGESTLRDTVKPVLIPCYDLSTGAPFVFSRADAMESDGYDFKMSEICGATCAADQAVKVRSVDGKTAIFAVGGGVAMGNPTSAAITHVLNNKQEFPFANGVEDLLVVSLGTGESDSVNGGGTGSAMPSRAELLKIAGNGIADTVDQAVAMAFGHNMTNNYVRIQSSGFLAGRSSTSSSSTKSVSTAEEMLSHRNVESVLFRGQKISELSNAEKLERFSEELIKEQARRKSNPVPTVLIKQAMTPRSSSATTTTAITSSSVDSY